MNFWTCSKGGGGGYGGYEGGRGGMGGAKGGMGGAKGGMGMGGGGGMDDYEDIYQMILKDSNLKGKSTKKNDNAMPKSKPKAYSVNKGGMKNNYNNNKFQNTFGGRAD